MENEYIKVMELIKESCDNQKFDTEKFEFYETRREKNKYSTGIIKYNNKYYFKIVKNNSYVEDEEYIKEMIKPNFSIIEKLGELKNNDEEIINLYKYIPAPKINAFNYLRNSEINFETKKRKLEEFFNNKIKLMKKNYNIEKMDGTKSADRWFWGRITVDPRKKKYYGDNFEKLYDDVLKYCPEAYENLKGFLDNIYDYLKEKNLTVTTYSHGDFHDFNFSLDGIFWDIDTFDFNPLLDDFATFYWHFYAREDYLVYKYCPWLTLYMNDKLKPEELKKVRNLKKEMILLWYDEIERIFDEYKIKENIKNEFIFKLFCRVFLINNVIEYEPEDKIKNYKFFNYFLNNKEKNIKDLLFSSNIIFER